jgi:hypothetical protein
LVHSLEKLRAEVVVSKRWLWVTLLSVMAGSVWPYAQPPPPPPTPPTAATPPATATPAADPVQFLYGPEVWRLPPVSGPTVLLPPPPPRAPIPDPPALAVPPIETLPPAPEPIPPMANMPMSLSGALSNGLKVEEKPEPNKVWEGSFDLGLDGSEGNTEAMNFRFGFHAQGKGENSVLTVGLDYNKRTTYTAPTTDRLFFDGRCERLIEDSSWSVFFHETIEYDQFQPFDVRDTSDTGVGYRMIKNELTTLIGRLGGGFSHEFGGPENGWVIPEAVFGLQLEKKIGKSQKFVGSMEYAPDVADFNRYRLRSQAALELLLDQARNLCMRIGVLERYNSYPNGARPNDLDYATTLMWKF